MDWGFTSFLALKEIVNLQKGFLVDDTLEVRGRQLACIQLNAVQPPPKNAVDGLFQYQELHPRSSFRKADLHAKCPGA